MSIKCITFDLDDTLWDANSVIAQAEREFYAWMGERFPRIGNRYALDALLEHRRDFYHRNPGLHHDLTGLRKQWLALLAADADYETEALVEEGFRVFWDRRNEVTLFEDARETLEDLRGRYRVGAITNGNADVHRIGVAHYFDFIITSAGAGAAKPHPDIFHAALDEAAVSAREAVHVGDDPERDVIGAARVGMRTVWVNPAWEPWPGGQTPDAVVRSVGELSSVIASWERAGERR